MNQSVKILQIGMTDNIGGMETYLMAQYKKINRNLVQYDFLNITGEHEIVFADEIRNNGDHIFSVPSRHTSPVFHYLKLFKLLYQKRHVYQYIVLNTCSLYYIFPLFAAALVGIPHRVIHSHNSGDEGKKTFLRSCLKSFNTLLLRCSATDYWACSQMAGEWMFGNQNFEVIHNAIDTKNFLYNPSIRKKMRLKLNLNGKFVIGTVARFSPQKNHEFLIEIFNEVVKRKKDSVLLLVGEAAGFKNRLQMIKKKVQFYHLEDKVLFLGMRDDTNELYQAMDCHLLPSKFEGLSITALEAQAAGLPCVCSDRLSEETKVTDYFYTLKLSDPPSFWAEFLLSHMIKQRKNVLQNFINSGYDIEHEVTKVVNLYTKRNV